MLAIGRLTPGLRTLTVVAAASAVPARIALPLLVLGSTAFLEAHLLLGYGLGAAASSALVVAGPWSWPSSSCWHSLRWQPRWSGRDVAGGAGTDARPDDGAEVHTWSEAACPACFVATSVPALRRFSTGLLSRRNLQNVVRAWPLPSGHERSVLPVTGSKPGPPCSRASRGAPPAGALVLSLAVRRGSGAGWEATPPTVRRRESLVQMDDKT